LQAVTVRIPAGLLTQIHLWAEQGGRDLATAIRELTTLGLEASRSSGAIPVDLSEVARWQPEVERALRQGESPLKPFLDHENRSVEALSSILAKIDYANIYEQLKEGGPRVEVRWNRLKAEAPPPVRALMSGLDELEKNFDARKKEVYLGEPEAEVSSVLQWLLSEPVLQQLRRSTPDKDIAEVEAVQKLIRARYLIPVPDQPWAYIWDE
jgi:hypothetical protein